MKKLLATTALTLVAFTGAASAQSVLERVLGQINGTTNQATLNGTFANIAENIGVTAVTSTVYISGGAVIDQAAADVIVAQNTLSGPTTGGAGGAGAGPLAIDDTYYNQATDTVLTETAYNALSASDKLLYTLLAAAEVLYTTGAGEVEVVANAGAYTTALNNANNAVTNLLATAETITVAGGLSEGINGSINNVINGLDTATMVAAVGAVTATEYLLPTIDLGNISSTVLGAVNTGEITLGVNQSVDQAKTTATGALSSVIDQIGGSADTSALVLNIASNMTGVNGSINNTMTGVNGSVGDAATTVLGAVNTGTIVSGVNAAVTGIVGGTSQSGL